MTKIFSKNLIRYEEIDSTSDEARRLILKGFDEGTAVVAESQTKGRGKPGRSWFSPKGLGIYLSVIVKPFKNPADLSLITLNCAKAVVKTINKTAKIDSSIKPPNDVLIKEKKFCGILVERMLSGHLIVGIGLNVNNLADSFSEELRETSTSLKIETGRDFKILDLINILLSELEQEYLAYLNEV